MDLLNIIDPSSLGIHYFFEEVTVALEKETLTSWLHAVVEEENKTLQSIRFIFCQDDYLHRINVAYLNHDTLTDVITFPYSDKEEIINGEIYISMDRIEENASNYKVSSRQELHRVMVHGVLHLCGYDDKEESSKKKMQELEDYYLNKLILPIRED